MQIDHLNACFPVFQVFTGAFQSAVF